MALNIIKYQISRPFIVNKHKYYILNRYKFPPSLDINRIEDRKKFVSGCNNNVNGENCNNDNGVSIFFQVCANNDVGSIDYCLEECNANLEMTDEIEDYKKIFKCKNEKCGQYNCLSSNFPPREKITPLMYAILKGNYSAINYLLLLGVNVNYQTECFGVTPLLLACRMKNIHIIKLLLNYNANITHLDVLNRNCLMHAVSNMVCLYYNDTFTDFNKRKISTSFIENSFFFRNLFYVLRDNINSSLTNFINTSELVRGYTVLHLLIKFFNKSLFDFALRHGAELSIKVYKNNNLKTVTKYQNIIEEENNDTSDYSQMLLPQQNFLSYCLCNIQFNCYHSIHFFSQLIDKNDQNDYEYFSRKETSDACLIAYLEFLKNNYFQYNCKEFLAKKIKNYIIKDKSNDYLIKNSNYPHFMDDNYFNLCLNSLGCNNKIIYRLLVQRNEKNKRDLKFKNVIKDSLALLNNEKKIVLGNKLWKLIFKNLLALSVSSSLFLNNEDSLNYFDILSKCIEKEFREIVKFQKKQNKFFNQFNKNHVYNVMLYVFEAAYILLVDNDTNVEKFKNLLQLIEKINQGIETFNIFYEAMRYVKRKIYEEEEERNGYCSNESNALPKLLSMLNLIKSFNKFNPHKKFIANSIGVNNIELIKFENFYLDTPLSIALLCATKCERDGICTHSNKDKYIKLVNFFIEEEEEEGDDSVNTLAFKEWKNMFNVERQHRYLQDDCFLYFHRNCYVIKSLGILPDSNL